MLSSPTAPTPDAPRAPARRSLLCPTEEDFARTMRTYRATHGARIATTLMLAGVAAGFGWSFGWAPAVAVAIAGAWLTLMDGFVRRASSGAEWVIAASYLVVTLTIAYAVGQTGGPHSPVLGAFVLPILLLANRFRRAVTVVGGLGAIVILAAVTVGVDAGAVRSDPSYVVATALAMACIVIFTLPVTTVEDHLRHTAHIDPLTGVRNRLSLDTRFAELTRDAGEHDSLSLILCDLDHFKDLNDREGHAAGDRALQRVAERLGDGTPGGDVVRLGGEEFAVLLPGVDADAAVHTAERLRLAVAALGHPDSPISASFGVATHPASTTQWLSLYRAADAALMRGKRLGRNRVVSSPDRGVAPPPPPRRSGDG